MKRVFRFLTGAIALAALGVQFWLMTKYPGARSLAVTVTHFLSFFTIQTNMLIALCMLVPAVAPRCGASRLLTGPSLRTAVASYSGVIAIVYFTLLRNIGRDDGLERLADQVMHYITPAMFLIDWLAWVPKGRVRWRDLGKWLIYPALYCAWTFLYGAVTGWYPYPFFNARRIRFAQLFDNFVEVACVVVAIPFLLLVVDRLLAALQTERRETAP